MSHFQDGGHDVISQKPSKDRRVRSHCLAVWATISDA